MPEENNDLMAQRIKELRIKNGLSQEQLAELLGLQKSAIAKYENGRVINIKRSTIANMAEIFHCNPSYIMGWSDSEYENNPLMKTMLKAPEDDILANGYLKQEKEKYYLNDDAREMAQFMFDNPEYKVLFDATRKVKKEDIEFVKDFIERLNK